MIRQNRLPRHAVVPHIFSTKLYPSVVYASEWAILVIIKGCVNNLHV